MVARISKKGTNPSHTESETTASLASVASPSLAIASPTGVDPNNLDGYIAAGSVSHLEFATKSNGAKNGDNIIHGTNGGDAVNSLGGRDFIYGWGGNDSLIGSSDADTIYGGSGNDIINGQSQNDVLFGGDGADQLFGEKNNDQLIGGYGADTLSGGAGNDTFVFNSVFDFGSNQACDSINDFQTGIDKIDLRDFDLASGASFTFAGFSTAGGAANSLWQVGTRIYGDTDGDANTAELAINVQAGVNLSASDFLLV